MVDPTVSPRVAAPVRAARIYLPNGTYKTIPVSPETTVTEAASKAKSKCVLSLSLALSTTSRKYGLRSPAAPMLTRSQGHGQDCRAVHVGPL